MKDLFVLDMPILKNYLETTMNIYGEAITQNAKAIILGSIQKIDKIKIDEVKYKVISQTKIKNKTSFFLEVDND